MQPGPERHAGVEGDDQVIGTGLEPAPARFDDEALADAVREEVLLPGVGPILLDNLADRWRADRPDSTEMPQRLFELSASTSALAGARHVTTHGDGGASRNDRWLVPGDLLPRLGRVLDNDA